MPSVRGEQPLAINTFYQACEIEFYLVCDNLTYLFIQYAFTRIREQNVYCIMINKFEIFSIIV